MKMVPWPKTEERKISNNLKSVFCCFLQNIKKDNKYWENSLKNISVLVGQFFFFQWLGVRL